MASPNTNIETLRYLIIAVLESFIVLDEKYKCPILNTGNEMHEFTKTVERVAGKIAPGRAPSFNEAQVIQVLEILDAYGTIGRIRLAKLLGVGEGVMRTLLKHLDKEGLITRSMRGITFSNRGKKLFANFRSRISKSVVIPSSSLSIGPCNVAILVRNVSSMVSKGIEQRDIAIKAGSLGATTLIYTNRKLRMPPNDIDVFKEIQPIHDLLVSKFNPGENDVIIIGSGENKRLAEIGAKMVAFEFLKSTK